MGKTPDNPSETLAEELDRQASISDASEPRAARRTIAELRAAKSRPASGAPDRAGREAEADAQDPAPLNRTVVALAQKPTDAGAPATDFVRDVPAREAPSARGTPARRFDEAAVEQLRLPARKGKLSAGFWISLLLLVALPTALAFAYYLFIASDQYVSEFRFAVRSSTPAAAPSDPVGVALGQSARMSSFGDNFIVADYVRSREAVADLSKSVDLRAIYSNPDADALARLDPSVPMERLVTYWQSMVDASFDVSTGISVVRIRAFTPEDSLRIAQALIGASEALVNRMAGRVRQDSVRFAEQHVKVAEERLRDITARLRRFRNVQQSPDLSTSASSTLRPTLQLRTSLAQMEARLTSLSTHMAPDAPIIKVLKNNIAATRDQLNKIEGEFGSGAAEDAGGPRDEGYAATLSDYEGIRLELQFAQQSYQTMLTMLDQVRSSALSDRIYLMPYVQPALAEYPLYPERATDILIVFLISGVAWAVVMLTIYAVRDHMI